MEMAEGDKKMGSRGSNWQVEWAAVRLGRHDECALERKMQKRCHMCIQPNIQDWCKNSNVLVFYVTEEISLKDLLLLNVDVTMVESFSLITTYG